MISLLLADLLHFVEGILLLFFLIVSFLLYSKNKKAKKSSNSSYIVDNVNLAFVLLDRNKLISLFNNRFKNSFSLVIQKKLTTGKNFLSFFSEKEQSELYQQFKEISIAEPTTFSFQRNGITYLFFFFRQKHDETILGLFLESKILKPLLKTIQNIIETTPPNNFTILINSGYDLIYNNLNFLDENEVIEFSKKVIQKELPQNDTILLNNIYLSYSTKTIAVSETTVIYIFTLFSINKLMQSIISQSQQYGRSLRLISFLNKKNEIRESIMKKAYAQLKNREERAEANLDVLNKSYTDLKKQEKKVKEQAEELSQNNLELQEKNNEIVIINEQLMAANTLMEERQEEIAIMNEELFKKNEELNNANIVLLEVNNQLEKEIKERKLLVTKLKRSEILYNSTVNAINDAICVINGDSAFELMNFEMLKLCKILKINVSENNFPHIEKVFFWFPYKTFQQCVEALNSQLIFCDEFELKNDSISMFFEVKIIPVLNEQKQIFRIIISMNNIDDRKKAEIQLKNTLEKQKEYTALKTNIVSRVSHEFRTPLSIILMSADFIRKYREKLTASEIVIELERIGNETKRLNKVIDDILFVNSKEAQQTILLERFDFKVFCQKIVEDMQIADNKEHLIDFLYLRDSSEINSDKKLLSTILTNLISNALKYSEKKLKIIFVVSESNEAILLQIKDFGIGIPEKEKEKVFGMFQRLSNVGNIQGTGLGLSIVKQSVELLEGEIFLESKPNEETVFTVKLPKN